jgi:hypothetical protein
MQLLILCLLVLPLAGTAFRYGRVVKVSDHPTLRRLG